MTLAHDALSDLEALAYEAALEPSLWPQVAADASRAFQAPHIMLGVLDRRGNEVMRAATQGVTELGMARYSHVRNQSRRRLCRIDPADHGRAA